ncbi:hypothetical protein HPP92_020135 [Vanilla planifolia]|uniref:Uncharacterized protein n=1 Tax=Vanilla planifolia TaxID=51239 RepID=A0A835UNK4_VANPL|nr:hypothetical protein HPP92_020135 [Vanilla planifolia]
MIRLLEIFSEATAPRDVALKLRAAAARPGLESFLSIVEEGIRVTEDGSLELQNWSRSQIEAVLSVAEAIVSASMSILVEQAGPLLVAIVVKCLELCLCYLEKFSFDGDDFSLQNDCLQIMEMALTYGSAMDHHAIKKDSLSTFLELLPSINVQNGNDDLQKRFTINLKGMNYLKGYSVDGVLKVLSSDSLEPSFQGRLFSDLPIAHPLNKIMSIVQHWAVVSLNCFPRLLKLCQELLQFPTPFGDGMDVGIFSLRVTFTGRVLKLLGHIMREVPRDCCDAKLLCSIAGCAEAISVLFKLEVDYLNFDSMPNGNPGNLVLLVLEEFLKFVHIGFLNSAVTQNIQVFIVASVLHIWDSQTWRYDALTSSAKAPLVYWPQLVLFILKLLNDVKIWMLSGKKFAITNYCLESNISDGPSCCIGLGRSFC